MRNLTNIIFFCPTWGMPPSPVIETVKKIMSAGYDGCEFGLKSFAEPAEEVRKRANEAGIKLIGQEYLIKELVSHVHHIHARVGHPQGAQVTDPRLPEWSYALERHLKWWDAIIDHHRDKSIHPSSFPITVEFGPQPYMPSIPFTGQPLADQ